MAVHIQQFMQDMGIDSFEDIGCLYQDYIFECNDIVNEIDRSIHSKTPSDIEKLIHNFKGVSANLYVQSVFEASKLLNDLLRANINAPSNNSDIINAWQSTAYEYSEAKDEIITFFSRNSVYIEPN